MAQGKRVVVSSTAVKIADQGCIVVVHNKDAANDIELGGAGLTAGTGYRLLHTDAPLTVDCRGDALHAIRSGGSDATVDVLITRAAGF